jgi:hypothetical protein
MTSVFAGEHDHRVVELAETFQHIDETAQSFVETLPIPEYQTICDTALPPSPARSGGIHRPA